MLGNDVVDLADPEAREAALHPRFDARVFSERERALLDAAAERPALRWTLWAAKEAAYKAMRRLDPALPFHPRSFVVEGDLVRHGARRFRLHVARSAGAVHAVALAVGFEARGALARVCAVPAGGSPGAAARALARRAAAALLGVEPGALEVARDGRVPRLLLRGADCGLTLSLSHHGRLAACALAPAGARPA